MGITEPKLTFSACFGAAFLPLHPTEYAKLFGEKMEKHEVNVWLINTGWTGGPYGVGSRIKLNYTRAMISAALEDKLDQVIFLQHPVFGFEVPQACPNVPSELLNPRGTWSDPEEYDAQAHKLAKSFIENFEKFEDFATKEILAGAPMI
jgi:phosphoenolpyruvate carboxykinase (ATP)